MTEFHSRVELYTIRKHHSKIGTNLVEIICKVSCANLLSLHSPYLVSVRTVANITACDMPWCSLASLFEVQLGMMY